MRLWAPAAAIRQPVTRFLIGPPPGEVFPGAKMRFRATPYPPDGRSVAVEAGPQIGQGPFQLWIRRLDSVEGRAAAADPRRPPSNIGIQGLFWFPDGRTIGLLR